jgi:dual specificity tyrosine-phosphorylation-regulated kinase 2/3/4
VVNSKGRRRRPGTKTLAQVLRCDDELFVDFIAKCLTWDPERRLKPHQALRHPYISHQRARSKLTSPVPSSTSKSLLSSSSGSSSRTKPTETPKKTQISAPTPLTARVSRTNSSTVVTATPNASSSSVHTLGSATRAYRASQSQTFSTYSSNSRSMASFAVRAFPTKLLRTRLTLLIS